MNQDFKPFVSIILPTYNRAYILSRSIDSVLNQTYDNFELIIVDDGSTDNTQEIVNSFDDIRIRYLQNEENKGVSSALNIGIRFSSGDFISFQGSDDIWKPNKLYKELEKFKTANNEVGIVYSRVCQIKSNKKKYVPDSNVVKKEGSIHQDLLKGNFVNGLSCIRRECFEKVGLFDENLHSLEDWELYLRISKYFLFNYVNETLVIASLGDDNLSVDPKTYINSAKLILKKHNNDFIKDRIALAINYSYIGSWYCLDGKTHLGRHYLYKSIRCYPFNYKLFAAYLISFLGRTIYEKFLQISHFRE